eukprot:gene5674-6256_t
MIQAICDYFNQLIYGIFDYFGKSAPYWNVHHPNTVIPTPEEFPAIGYEDHLRLGKMIQVIYDIFNNNGNSELFGNIILVTERNLEQLVERTFPGYSFERRLRTIIRVDNGEDATSFMGYILTKTLPNGKKEVVMAYRGTVTLKEWLENADAFPTVWNLNNEDGVGCDDFVGSQCSCYDYLQMFLPMKVYKWLPYTNNDPIKLHHGFKRLYVTDRDVEELSDNEIERITDDLREQLGVDLSVRDFRALTAARRIQYITEINRGVLEGPQTRCRAFLDKLLKNGQLEKVTVTGHSLGASLAIITALDLAQYLSSKPEKDRVKVEAVTFACPRIGNYRFLDALRGARVKHYHHYVRGDFVPFAGFYSTFREDVDGLYQPFRYGELMPFLLEKYRRPKIFLVSLLASTVERKTEYLGVYHNLDVILHNLCHSNGVIDIPRSIAFVNRGGDHLDSKYSAETKTIPPYWFTGLANRGMHMRTNGEIGEITLEDLRADQTGRLQHRLGAFIDLYVELNQ